jgi:hypothetical protein
MMAQYNSMQSNSILIYQGAENNNNNNNNNNTSNQFSGYLLTCTLKSTSAYYKASTKTQIKHKLL